MITFTCPDKMKNGQLERLLVAIEEALRNRDFGPFVTAAMRDAADEHSERAIHELLGSYLMSWCEVCGRDDPPSEDAYKSRALKQLADQRDDAAVRELRDFQWDTSHYHGKVAMRCDLCGRLRHGMKWRKNCPTPEGWIEMQVTCPDCERQCEYHVSDPDPTEAEMQAWLAKRGREDDG